MASLLPIDKLKKLAEKKLISPTKRAYTSAGYSRNPIIAAYALRRANGNCQLCEQPAPFYTKKKEPFLHVHHINYLSAGGLDVVENVVGLCPNCHSKIHILEDPRDTLTLKKKALILL